MVEGRDLERVVGRRRRRAAEGLGHPVPGDERPEAEPGGPELQLRGRERLSRDERGAHVGQSLVDETRVVRQLRPHRRDGPEERDAVREEELNDLLDVELVPDHGRRPVEQRAEEAHEVAADVRQRHRAVHDVVRSQPDRGVVVLQVDDRVVRDDDTLGLPGRARRVEDVERVAGPDLGLALRDVGGGHLLGPGEELVVRDHPAEPCAAHRDDVFELREPLGAPHARLGVDELGDDLADTVEERVAHELVEREQHAWSRRSEQRLDLARPVAVVDRHHDRARTRDRREEIEPVDAVRQQHRDPVALLDAEGEQRTRVRLGPSFELGVGQLLAVLDDRDAVRVLRERAVERGGEGLSPVRCGRHGHRPEVPLTAGTPARACRRPRVARAAEGARRRRRPRPSRPAAASRTPPRRPAAGSRPDGPTRPATAR